MSSLALSDARNTNSNSRAPSRRTPMVKIIHHHAPGNITRYTLVALPAAFCSLLSGARSLLSLTLTVCSQRSNVRDCRILLSGLATRSHLSSTWRAPPPRVSLASSPPRVGVLACVCCSALRDENWFENVSEELSNHKRTRKLASSSERSLRAAAALKACTTFRACPRPSRLRVVASVERGKKFP